MAAYTKVGVGYNVQIAVDAKHKMMNFATTLHKTPIFVLAGMNSNQFAKAGCAI
jgi:hypothetical protein